MVILPFNINTYHKLVNWHIVTYKYMATSPYHIIIFYDNFFVITLQNYMNDVDPIGRIYTYLYYSTICQHNMHTYFDRLYNRSLIALKCYGIFRTLSIIAN